jgi:hypothetical protein
VNANGQRKCRWGAETIVDGIWQACNRPNLDCGGIEGPASCQGVLAACKYMFLVVAAELTNCPMSRTRKARNLAPFPSAVFGLSQKVELLSLCSTFSNRAVCQTNNIHQIESPPKITLSIIFLSIPSSPHALKPNKTSFSRWDA